MFGFDVYFKEPYPYLGRNPCCSGCLVSTEKANSKKELTLCVAILVVVDVWFRHNSNSKGKNTTRRRNPCCSGCLVSTADGLRKMVVFYVAILVVVDVWFRQVAATTLAIVWMRRNPCCSGCLVSTRSRGFILCFGKTVAILVVVDVWFRRYEWRHGLLGRVAILVVVVVWFRLL